MMLKVVEFGNNCTEMMSVFIWFVFISAHRVNTVADLTQFDTIQYHNKANYEHS